MNSNSVYKLKVGKIYIVNIMKFTCVPIFKFREETCWYPGKSINTDFVLNPKNKILILEEYIFPKEEYKNIRFPGRDYIVYKILSKNTIGWIYFERYHEFKLVK